MKDKQEKTEKIPEKSMVIAMYIVAILAAGNGWLMYLYAVPFWQAHLNVVMGIFLLFVAMVAHKQRSRALRSA